MRLDDENLVVDARTQRLPARSVAIDQGDQIVRQWLARDRIVEFVQLLVQPPVERRIARGLLAWPVGNRQDAAAAAKAESPTSRTWSSLQAAPSTTDSSPVSISLSAVRAREMRLLTVPTDTSDCTAIRW